MLLPDGQAPTCEIIQRDASIFRCISYMLWFVWTMYERRVDTNILPEIASASSEDPYPFLPSVASAVRDITTTSVSNLNQGGIRGRVGMSMTAKNWGPSYVSFIAETAL